MFTCYQDQERMVWAILVVSAGLVRIGKSVDKPRAVLKTVGTVFPNTDQLRSANNVFSSFLYGSFEAQRVIKKLEKLTSVSCSHFTLF